MGAANKTRLEEDDLGNYGEKMGLVDLLEESDRGIFILGTVYTTMFVVR